MESGELIKDSLKTKVYIKNIPMFIEKEFNEDMDQKKRTFFNDAKNLSFNRFLVSAARGFGKTWLLAKLALWSTTVVPSYYKESYSVSILGGSREQSNKAYTIVRDSIEKSDYVKRRIKGDPIKTKTRFKDGSMIRALAASSKSIRGVHENMLCGDEWAELDEDLIIAATESVDEYRPSKGITFPPRFVIVSTPHVYDSFFVKHLQNPEEWGFKTYKWKAIDSYNKSKSEVEDAKSRLDSRKFKREWLGEPTSMRSTLIDKEDIQKSIIRYEPEITTDGYITAGCDWGKGGKNHPSAMVIVQKQQNFDYVIDAKLWSKKKKFEWIKDRVLDLYDKYEVDVIYADSSHLPIIERIRDEGAHIRSISFASQKANMITNTLFKFENGRVKIPHKFNDLIEQVSIYHRKRREKDDLFDALLLSLYGQKRAPRKRTRSETDKDLIQVGGKR